MRTGIVQKCTAVALLVLGMLTVWQGLGHSYYGRFGPGPGFFPVWVGALLMFMSAALLVSSFRESQAEMFLPSPDSLKRLLLLGGACATLVPALGLLGFRVSMFVFALFLPQVLGRRPWVQSLAMAVAAGFLVAWVFESFLNVRLPRSSIPMLRTLGL